MAGTDVTRDALEYLVEAGKKLSPVEIKEFDGRRYSRQELKPIKDPTISALAISTLSSLADLCTGHFGQNLVSSTTTKTAAPGAMIPVPVGTDPNRSVKDALSQPAFQGFEGFDPALHVVHVVSHKQVQVVTAKSNAWGDREVLIDCTMIETKQFQTGLYMSQEQFIIELLSCFLPSDDRAQVIRIAGNATAEYVTTSQDDGVTQSVALRSGATLASKEVVKNIVSLSPFRTFREVDQPASDFLFRLKQSPPVDGKPAGLPTFAFFEADGGKWKLEAIENVARHLRVKIPLATIVS